MAKDLELLKEKYKSYRDGELRKIVYVFNSEYEQEAVDAARRELFFRYPDNIWEDTALTLGKLIKCSELKEIEETLGEIFPEEAGKWPLYSKLIVKLKTTKPSETSDIKIFVSKKPKGMFEQEGMVWGIDKTSGETVEVQYSQWSEWLAFLLDNKQLQAMGKEEYIILCLRKMTSISFDEEEIQKAFEEICNFNEDDINEPELPPCDEVTMDNFISSGIQKRNESIRADSIDKNTVNRPWIRLFARAVDITVFSNICMMLSYLASPDLYKTVFLSGFSSYIIGTVEYILWIPIEAMLISRFGFTIGKWLFGVNIRDGNGNLLNYETAQKRAFSVFVYGEGFSFFILPIITYIISYRRLKNTGKTKWDETYNISVSHGRLEAYKVATAILIFVVICARALYFSGKL